MLIVMSSRRFPRAAEDLARIAGWRFYREIPLPGRPAWSRPPPGRRRCVSTRVSQGERSPTAPPSVRYTLHECVRRGSPASASSRRWGRTESPPGAAFSPAKAAWVRSRSSTPPGTALTTPGRLTSMRSPARPRRRRSGATAVAPAASVSRPPVKRSPTPASSRRRAASVGSGLRRRHRRACSRRRDTSSGACDAARRSAPSASSSRCLRMRPPTASPRSTASPDRESPSRRPAPRRRPRSASRPR